MISEDKFIELMGKILDIQINENQEQKDAIMAQSNESQYIVAGPGSGKTTVLVFKILKYLFVDDIKLENIIVTTFTKKAAKELKERITYAYELIAMEVDVDSNMDFSKLLIGTLDSLAEELLSEYVDVEIIDNFTSSAIMMKTLLTNERNKDKRLKQFFKKMKNFEGGVSTSELNNNIQTIKERLYYDLVDKVELEKNADREKVLYEIINEYIEQLSDRKVMDYAMLENEFYNLLNNHKLKRLERLSILLIDEYQDTNLLQEQIYFKIAEYVKQNNGSITVVGDDDQSLYRFRGATIQLFTNYLARIKEALDITPKTIYLQKNYRSSKNIIDFANEFIHLDDKYQEFRTINKPYITSSGDSSEGLPVMGMFRNNIEELSTDLSNLIYDLKVGNGFSVTRHGKEYIISAKKDNPSIAVLTNSPKEISAYNKKRLPYYIRETLSYKEEDIVVFNPRGQSIETTEIASLICGLILISIDPDRQAEQQLDNLPPHTKNTLKNWRKYAEEYVSQHDKEIFSPSENINIKKLLEDINEECFALVEQSNENAIFHDIIMETILQTDNAINDEGILTLNQIFWHILVPIASGAIEIDDDMFDIRLEENVNIMSIHQSKGLEFDIVIVDVGSDIFNNSSSTAFKRFPKKGDRTHNIENYLKQYSSTNYSDDTLGIDKSFNDLIRRYFVAYTRPKSILILVGLNNMRYGIKGDFQNKIYIENVATGWSRDKVWHWDSLNNLLQI
ncbi:MAG: UvrD-helicase domain-containing protein [Methanosphaera sp.]|nr:UvrD-helicase domain-containing protein [Methanosphaera sp.]